MTPYYNKPTTEGLYRHYAALAGATRLPIVVYNVPGRTSCNVKPDLLRRLAALDNVVAVKEASGDIGQMVAICQTAANDFAVLSGDDSVTLPLMALGGAGVISVASNEIPSEMGPAVRGCACRRLWLAPRNPSTLLPVDGCQFLRDQPRAR